MKIYDFDEQDKIGKIGESVVIQYFHEVLNKQVEVVRGDPTYQKEGIDFIIKESGATVEVKTDNRPHENIFLETVNSTRYGTLGWINTICADWIAFYKSSQEKIYMINVLELKKFFFLGRFGFENFAIPKYTKDKKQDYGIGVTVDLALILKIFGRGHLEVFDLKK